MDLLYFHDPMCSWCWAYRPVSDRLRKVLPPGIRWLPVLGGLAPDSDAPMTDEMQKYLVSTWKRIRDTVGTEFNFDYWETASPRRSTYPACRAVLAGGHQDAYDAMTDGIQRAYYLHARNPSDTETLAAIAAEIGLDIPRFLADLAAEHTNEELMRQVELARTAPVRGLPSLVLRQGDQLQPVTVDYQSESGTLAELRRLSR